MAELQGYLTELERFRASDQARDRLVNDLVEKFKTLSEDYENLKSDYHSERDGRRNYQRLVEEQKQESLELAGQIEASSFILALIDGDGAIFQNIFLQAACGEGGSEAASRLNQAIRDHVASFHPNSGKWPIMVNVYLSLDKLAQKLAHVGLLRTQADLRSFAQRFNVNQPLFSIVDVGQGKERADHKIKEMLRNFSENPTCRHIIFGGCHDAGYLLNLEQFRHDPKKASCITLLETTPMYRDFASLAHCRKARFDDVFRSDPLPESGPATHSALNNFAQPMQAAIGPPNLQRAITNESTRSGVVSPSPSTGTGTPPSSVIGDGNGDFSYANVGKNGTNEDNFTVATTAKKTKKKKYAYYNKEGERLDEPLPQKDSAAAAALEDRMKRSGKKMCNHFHLGHYCSQGKFCKFQHEPRLSPGELTALMYKTRSLACANRKCEDLFCYLGHQCALERDRGTCYYPKDCNLRQSHGMDRVKYARWDQEGNVEYA